MLLHARAAAALKRARAAAALALCATCCCAKRELPKQVRPRTGLAAAVDHLVQVELLLGALLHALLHAAGRAEAVHMHRLLLPDAVHARHRLQVPLRAAGSQGVRSANIVPNPPLDAL